MAVLEFEKPIQELEDKIHELRELGTKNEMELGPELQRLNKKLQKLQKDIYGNLTTWQRIQIARHPSRPYTLDYIQYMMKDFIEIHGDRMFADDSALVAGFATLGEEKILVLGQQKGRDTTENIKRNFGCAHPEGYRKAMRVMKIAAKFRLPVITFIDTPGAYPGIGAEERGQAQAIAENLRDMSIIGAPIISVVIGEGGSGGALGIGVSDKVLILQHSYYSVISPEGCASILWRNSTKAPDACEALKLMGENLKEFGIVEDIVPEPLGGAHRNPEFVFEELRKKILPLIKDLKKLSTKELLDQRYARFRKIGKFIES